MPVVGTAAGDVTRGAGGLMGDAAGNGLPDGALSGGLPVSGPVG
ncbi:hypothetical protein [Streptomyces somaliensis]|nr:hypothetical protein [Streptomyces somaliensis]